MDLKEIYNDLKGTRVNQGELTIPNFTDPDYEELYYYLLETLAPYIGENYEFWYTKTARSYHKYKARGRRTFDFYDPQYEKSVGSQSIREQLATLKYYLQKRAYSRYPLKYDMEE
jgi:hypothetical protein